MSGAVLHRGEGWRARLATPEDDDALCALMRAVPMEGALTVAQERDPDFFALARAVAPFLMETFVAEDDAGRLVGCGTCVLREGRFPDGATRGVGCASDLRVLPAWRGARVLPALGRVALERARDAHGVHVFQAAVLDGNRRVAGATAARGPARAEQPVSRPMTPYHMLSVPPGGRGDAGVARATEDDLDEVARFLDEGQRTRVFGHRVDRKLLEARLAAWPGLAVSDFLLLRDGTGALAACAAPWDASSVRRYRVLAHRGWTRPLARLAGARLPAPGGLLRAATLSHLEVRDDDPTLFARVLKAARAHVAGRGLHLVNAFVPRASPLQRGARGPRAWRTPMTLLATQLHDSPWKNEDFTTARPGFEMALA